MIANEDRLAHALESAVEEFEFTLDAESIDFQATDSPNTNQYIIVFADGARRAYVTSELSWDDTPMVFVDIYSVDAYGEESWMHGDMSVSEAITYIVNA